MGSKYLKYVHGFVWYIWNKIRYKGKFSCSPFNALSNKCFVNIEKNGSCSIGKKLRVDGPFYLKSYGTLNIGEQCYFNRNCSITVVEAVDIGNGVFLGNNVVLVDHDHIMGDFGVEHELSSEPIVIEDRVWIGANCTITKGVRIGTGAVVAANSVVTRNIPPHTICASAGGGLK